MNIYQTIRKQHNMILYNFASLQNTFLELVIGTENRRDFQNLFDSSRKYNKSSYHYELMSWNNLLICGFYMILWKADQ